MHNGPTAIIYDWMDKWGGVERVLTQLITLFPMAHFYTSAVDFKTAPWAKKFNPQTTFLQNLPPHIRGIRKYLIPTYPLAFESIDLRSYKTVISITSSFAKSVITHPDTTHICYLLTPTRFLWSHSDDYVTRWTKLLSKPIVEHMKRWDLIASTRPDKIISISDTVKERCAEYYGRRSSVVYPPFDSNYWDKQINSMKRPKHFTHTDNYFLYVGRMERYKMPHLVIQVAKTMPTTHFVFVGTGSMMQWLKRQAPANCHFVEFITDVELSYLYTHAEGLIFPQDEDFGYVSIEAQYHGCPVIAFRKGGAVETVKDGKSGIFFDNQTVASLSAKLETYSKISYNLKHSTQALKLDIRKRFGFDRFCNEFLYQLHH